MNAQGYTGGCACGAIRYDITGDPVMAGHCQCRACQRASGTGHGSHMVFRAAAVHLTGSVTLWDSPADSGSIVSRAFCPVCGSPVYSTSNVRAQFIIIRAASLDDPSRFQPQMVVWAKSGQSWDHIDPALAKFDTIPPR